MFSGIESKKELIEGFRSLFKDSEKYWKHLVKHVIPRKVTKEFEIQNWKKALFLSEKLKPFQVNYAIQFLDTLSYAEKIAIQELPNADLKRFIFFSSKNRTAIVFESTGEVATVLELDKFKSWREWKNHLLSRGTIIEESTIRN